jgi:sugar phosphate isomerase/epimerase
VRAGEKKGIALAIENHQDAASEDLLWLCREFESPAFGVVLDAANPLATAEHPLTFARQVAPYVRYLHLKDYEIYWSDEGYRLVRCPVGTGVVPFSEMLRILAEHGYTRSGSIERAAHEARHVRCFAEDFWPDYKRRSAAQFAQTMAFVRHHARASTEDYRTPFERGEPIVAIQAYEERQLEESIRAMSAVTGDAGPLRKLSA